MTFYHTFLLATSLLYASTVSADKLLKDNSPNCTCYQVQSDTDTEYFAFHRFYDFRYLASGDNDDDDSTDNHPPLVTENQDEGTEQTPSASLNQTQFTDDWNIQDWGKKATDDFPTRMQNSPQNVYVVQTNASELNATDPSANSYLSLRTYRLPGFQSAAEVENSQKNLKYASLRVRARIIGDAGAVAGMFTFVDDTNESDIEILTQDSPSTYRYTNQPSVNKKGNEVEGASQAPADLPDWTQWQTHRLDWLNKQSRWFVDGALAAASRKNVPKKPSGLILNMWSDGGEWSGNMSVGGVAYLQVQWVQVVFNTSGAAGGPGSGRKGDSKKRKRTAELAVMEREDRLESFGRMEKRKGHGCEVVCKIDDVAKEGFPEVVYVAPSEGTRGEVSSVLIMVVVGLASLLALI